MSYSDTTATNTQSPPYHWGYCDTCTIYSSDTGTTITYTPSFTYETIYSLDGNVGYVMHESKKEQSKNEQPIHLDKLTEKELFEVFKDE